mgnify:CR=1 FL=1
MWRLLFADAFQLDVKPQASLLAVAGGYVSAVEEYGMLYYGQAPYLTGKMG